MVCVLVVRSVARSLELECAICPLSFTLPSLHPVCARYRRTQAAFDKCQSRVRAFGAVFISTVVKAAAQTLVRATCPRTFACYSIRYSCHAG